MERKNGLLMYKLNLLTQIRMCVVDVEKIKRRLQRIRGTAHQSVLNIIAGLMTININEGVGDIIFQSNREIIQKIISTNTPIFARDRDADVEYEMMQEVISKIRVLGNLILSADQMCVLN